MTCVNVSKYVQLKRGYEQKVSDALRALRSPTERQ
jgi:hypothetical protein